MEEQQEIQNEISTCEYCKEYQGTVSQLRGHKIHCKSNPVKPSKQPSPDVPETPEPKQETKPETRERTEPERRQRIPLGVPRQKLRCPPDDEKFHYHIFNDNWAKDPGRIQNALNAGYIRLEGYDPITVGTNADGSAIKGVRMKIPRKFYDEDQKLKQQEVDKVDQAIKGGTIEQQAGDNRYIPQGIKIWSNQNENG